ncbi:DUF1643 domain-containing protein [Cohaesibacter sp. CAU 1516]|uniref:DUF1643 domain-containing protein n=1 Tax=Cohaesibacter sp. CAU 1516 TaxID=2576038 RepID=UPI0010FEBC2E|nr:DUF1643 domain-containing protein [Cohaesibacter sp. CAU 1516]TLP46975.1 DUF1643 domain-containing protein [Cohaesibacter sp. CAU 1516]
MTPILRQHEEAGTLSSALYSPCETYRYALTRQWDESGKKLLFIMLNPSKATELKNDPTIERCERRARALGFGGFRACNLFAFRATDPRDLKKAKDPIGPDNLSQLMQAARWADVILCAWGTHGAHMGLGPAIKSLLLSQGHSLQHLGLSKEGHPRHPLYVSYETQLERWH